MPAHHYHFVTSWRVKATVNEIAEIFADTESLTRWWPSTFLAVEVEDAGGPGQIGKLFGARVKGWMPHTLQFRLRVVRSIYPQGFTLESEGDFRGRCHCWAVQDGAAVRVYWDWKVEVVKPFVRHLSRALRPLFASNHLWVIARGEESLRLELERRRALRRGTPPPNVAPPGPTFPHGAIRNLWRNGLTLARTHAAAGTPDWAGG